MFLINDKDTQFKKHWICLRALTVRACSQAAGGRPAGGLRVCVTLNFDPLSLLSSFRLLSRFAACSLDSGSLGLWASRYLSGSLGVWIILDLYIPLNL